MLLVTLAACGRLGFDSVSSTGASTGDGAAGDGLGGDVQFGDGPPALSCESLTATCGPGTSCCESPLVTGGTFYRSYDGVGYNEMSYPATLSTFRLDRFEVTVGRFRQFVNAGYGTQQNPPAAGAGGRPLNGVANAGGWNATWNTLLPADTTALVDTLTCNALQETWTDTPGSNENKPINCISWFVAMAFCLWDGGFLPTEAEWNYAASGGSLQRAYPWSSPPTDLTLDSTYASYDCMGDGMVGCTTADLTPVGTKPSGDALWGQSDLAGNLDEWVLDRFASPYATPCSDCADLTSSSPQVIRGGGYNYAASSLRTGRRGGFVGTDYYGFVGARCGRTP